MDADAVELDVRRTADGVLVLMHDETVDRTTNGKGRVVDLTAAQIGALRLRAGAGGRHAPLTDEHPPTFEAAMSALRGRILVNLDAKADVYDDAFSVLERTGTANQVIMKRRVRAGDSPLLERAPFDRVLAMPIVAQQAGSAPKLLRTQLAAPPPAVELVFANPAYFRKAVPMIRQAGSQVWVNTLRRRYAGGLVDSAALADPDAVWGILIRAGATMIQTDEPQALLDYLTRTGRRSAGYTAARRRTMSWISGAESFKSRANPVRADVSDILNPLGADL